MDDDRWYDINVIAGAFKSFMRELPANALGSEALNELRDLTGEARNAHRICHWSSDKW
jgi:hypothetical protein